MWTFRNCYMLFPASFKLALMCSCLLHLLSLVASCSFIMHHTSCASCLVHVRCVYYVVCFFSIVSHFVGIVRIRSSTIGLSSWLHLLNGLVLLPSGISGKMTATLDLTAIIAMLVASFYRYVALPIFCSSSLPNCREPLTFDTIHSQATVCIGKVSKVRGSWQYGRLDEQKIGNAT